MNTRQERSLALEHWRNTGVIIPGAQSVVAAHRAALSKSDDEDDPANKPLKVMYDDENDQVGYCGACGARSSKLGECPACGGELTPVGVSE